MNKQLKIVLVTLLSFGLYYYVDELYFYTIREGFNGLINQYGISHILAYIIVGIPILLGTLLLHQRHHLLQRLGLNQSIVKGFVFALICTLPMFIGFAFLFDLNEEISFNTILIGVIAAGLFEELYFRGFLFGQLFRFTRLGFITSVLLGAVLFGLVHIKQGTSLDEIIGIFLVTFMGGILFAWLFVEWNCNLWVSIFLHMLMNLAWDLFAVSDNALGDNYSNIYRIATISLSIILTIIYKKRKGISLQVTRSNLIMKAK